MSEQIEAEFMTLEQAKECHIKMALELTSGNKTKAAQILEVDRRTLHRYTKKFKMAQKSSNGAGNGTAVQAET